MCSAVLHAQIAPGNLHFSSEQNWNVLLDQSASDDMINSVSDEVQRDILIETDWSNSCQMGQSCPTIQSTHWSIIGHMGRLHNSAVIWLVKLPDRKDNLDINALNSLFNNSDESVSGQMGQSVTVWTVSCGYVIWGFVNNRRKPGHRVRDNCTLEMIKWHEKKIFLFRSWH